MKAVIQLVNQASVSVKGEKISRIENGFLVLLAVKSGDSKDKALKMADKIARLRIFMDENEKMNRSLLGVGGKILLVSQFTLYGNAEKGNRPSFILAARPEEAKPLIKIISESLENLGIEVKEGVFGEHMQVSLVNDGPTTIIIEL